MKICSLIFEIQRKPTSLLIFFFMVEWLEKQLFPLASCCEVPGKNDAFFKTNNLEKDYTKIVSYLFL